MKAPLWFTRLLLAIGIGLVLCMPGLAQEPQQFGNAVFAGAVATTEQAATQQFQFSAAFRKQLTGPIHTMTFWDVSGVTLKPLNVSTAQYSGSQALTLKAYQPRPWLSLWLLGEAGLLGTDGIGTGATFGGGGYAEIDFGKRIHALIMPKAVKNTLTGTAFQTRIYIGTVF